MGSKVESALFTSCISYYGRSQVMRQVPPKHWDKVFVSRCGIELDNMNDLGHIHQRQSGEAIRILCVGRLSSEKGQLGVIEAFSLAYQTNKTMQLILVGDGPDQGLLKKYTKEKNIASAVTFVGAVSEEEVFKHMKDSDILVLPSFMEGIPMVLMEAMALHLPVIASRVAGIPELIFDKENGLLFDPGHWEQLADNILLLAAQDDLREQLAKQARTRVLEEFVIEKAITPLFERFSALDHIK